MSRPAVSFQYHFYPVGQGLFASGTVCTGSKRANKFHWVYDCGSSSSKKLVNAAISQLATEVGSSGSLDLVTVSHFDEDHINGIVALLGTFRVKRLMLPYMTLAQRLLIAFEERLSRRSRSIDFIIDPVGFLLGDRKLRVERVLFIPPSGSIHDSKDSFGKLQSIMEDGESTVSIDGRAPDTEEITDLNLDQTNSRRVEFLKRGGTIRYRKIWEFVPYNDDPRRPIAKAFVDAVHCMRQDLTLAATSKVRKQALDSLEALYDQQFGESSVKRNVISLYLYGGFLGRRKKSLSALLFGRYCQGNRLADQQGHERALHQLNRFRKTSILYTGDGFLNTIGRLRRLSSFFGKSRIMKVGCLQVMHHGSQNNWFKGLAKLLAPAVSVFSSDPNNRSYGHPHGPVVQDFFPYCPIQVDRKNVFTMVGWL